MDLKIRKPLKTGGLCIDDSWNADACEIDTKNERSKGRAGRRKCVSDNVFACIHKLFTTERMGPPERRQFWERGQKYQDISPFFAKLFP